MPSRLQCSFSHASLEDCRYVNLDPHDDQVASDGAEEVAILSG
jgi:hypothetical protein